MHISILFQILSYYGLLQDLEYSSLCHTVGLCYLSILYIAIYLSLLKYTILGSYSIDLDLIISERNQTWVFFKKYLKVIPVFSQG